ncbi:hypothetical protein FHS14_002340 [Paenibacillus baekrokdamisoli]|uniref:hypothetical protein n=1 Tax=Paenibacillus baekrokdamisoli TaxID=1712516 RepID=UPI0013DFD763|nr:hypothetical protein [Paenibacillus baekrokdamisoli]MBB3069350.1 hypothetical protein [Paenibacillus baekrokdamisoli]
MDTKEYKERLLYVKAGASLVRRSSLRGRIILRRTLSLLQNDSVRSARHFVMASTDND